MSRVLLTLALCWGFPSAQQQVIEGRRAAIVLHAAGRPDHAPAHDWRRVGGGTTRAVGQRTVAERDPAWGVATGCWTWAQRAAPIVCAAAVVRSGQLALPAPRPLRL